MPFCFFVCSFSLVEQILEMLNGLMKYDKGNKNMTTPKGSIKIKLNNEYKQVGAFTFPKISKKVCNRSHLLKSAIFTSSVKNSTFNLSKLYHIVKKFIFVFAIVRK